MERILTLTGLSIAAETESGATTTRAGFVAVAQQTDVRATSSLPQLIHGTCVAAH